MVRWRRRRTWLLFGLYRLAVSAVSLNAGPVVKVMDKVFKNSVWNQRGNFESRGVLIHIVQERSAIRPGAPARHLKEVARPWPFCGQSKRSRKRSQTAGAERQPRNVHMIVLESFWDAALLTGSGLSEDPLDPEFRKLWQAAGNSHVLSPVFGGYTANPEFEVLCGMPVTENHVFFEAGLQIPWPACPRCCMRPGIGVSPPIPTLPGSGTG